MRSRSASRRAILFEQACDERWWKEYAEELEKFRRLRIENRTLWLFIALLLLVSRTDRICEF